MNTAEFETEKARLDATLACIDGEMKDLDTRLTGNIEAANEDTVEALTQAFLRRLKTLILIKDKPYFARVDFTPQSGKSEKLYIGKSSVLDDRGNSLVVDWRAPVSTLYYDGRVGAASYTCPDGVIDGEILLKRQLEIENRTLLSYSDIDITFDEELLKPYLTVSSGTRLKNIIATIQTEQNRIIRAGMLRPLIVQGAAGSGKTTVALHRIAYLIYTYSASIKPEEFMVIAPNAIFLDYIANILPDLGVENVRQTTFEAFVQEYIGKKLTVEDPGEKLARLISGTGDAEEIPASRFKSSLAFRDAVDGYLADVEKALLPQEDFRAGRYVLLQREKIAAMFLVEYRTKPFAKRVSLMKERLLRLLKDRAGGVLNAIELDRRRRIAQLPQGLPAAEYKIRKQQIFSEDEDIYHDLLSGGKNILKAYLKKIRLPAALECYRGLVRSMETLKKYAGGADEKILAFVASRARTLSKGRAEYEDLAPLLYIHHRIHGAGPALSVRHAVIDEAQDFSLFQFYALKEALGLTSMTIFGDIAQGIYGYRGTGDWETVGDTVFGGRCDYAVLEKSYRSTVEIMEQAGRVLAAIPECEGLQKAVPVIRNGDPVRFSRYGSTAETAAGIAARVTELQGAGMKNIAVICKTIQGCDKFAALLKKHGLVFHLLAGKEYAGGLSIVPSYLVKGLEFDAAVVADAQLYGENETDSKLLYVAMTRAMHRLDICYTGEAPAILRRCV